MTIFLHISLLLVFLFFSNPIESAAKIKDGIKCVECHTMHASQNNQQMGEGTPREGLLLLSCLGCHTGDNPDSSGRSAPFVNSTSEPLYDLTGTESNVNTLAGGTFYWSYNFSASENKGHNVQPGQAPTSTDPPGGGTMATQLTCAGATGCHGNQTADNDYKAMTKTHHKDDSTIDGNTVGTSYRFLAGKVGLEDPDWELPNAGAGLSSTKHNQYKGPTDPPGYDDDPTTSDTITSVCAGCHGNFHGSTAYPDGTENNGVPPYNKGESPWLRHPTDIDMADATYNSTDFDSYKTYNPIAPVASDNEPLVLVTNNVQTAGNGIVTCISCHRAHGSRWAYNLRWNYIAWPGGTDAYDGCSICHSSKK
jgi:hypothetical protein